MLQQFIISSLSNNRRLSILAISLALIAGLIRILAYFIHYNSSYPFPWLYHGSIIPATNLPVALLFALLLFLASRKSIGTANKTRFWLFHGILSLAFSALHVFLIVGTPWVFGYHSKDAIFSNVYRFELAGNLHTELLLYWTILGGIHGLFFIRNLLESAKKKENQTFDDRIIIKTQTGELVVETLQVDWFEAYDNYVKVHISGKTHLLRERIGNLVDRLNPQHFQRVHRSAIVNLARVSTIEPGQGRYY